jgi:hypothetical protein
MEKGGAATKAEVAGSILPRAQRYLCTAPPGGSRFLMSPVFIPAKIAIKTKIPRACLNLVTRARAGDATGMRGSASRSGIFGVRRRRGGPSFF